MDIRKKLAANLRRIAVKRKTSLEKLAYENRISKGYMYDIANGKANVSLLVLDKLAKGLKVQAKDLLS